MSLSVLKCPNTTKIHEKIAKTSVLKCPKVSLSVISDHKYDHTATRPPLPQNQAPLCWQRCVFNGIHVPNAFLMCFCMCLSLFAFFSVYSDPPVAPSSFVPALHSALGHKNLYDCNALGCVSALCEPVKSLWRTLGELSENLRAIFRNLLGAPGHFDQ